ncbi:MAG: ABC transporter ATP-binding protein [Lachnospiraceae bacterium]|nr:ABC transporter ATP-binding protein [Lachnospiraceae bacterium]
MSKFFEVNGLKVVFKSGSSILTAVQDVSFSMKKGETLGIVGESGCGKSVTATAIMRLLQKGVGEIADGTIVLNGRDLTQISEKEMRKIRGGEISMIFQDPMTALNPVYTIGFQMTEMLLAHSSMTKEQAKKRAIEMLAKVGIPLPEERINAYPHELSGGMRQRVMIAMALSTNPQLLIADEPTTALDVTIQAQILDLMRSLKDELNMSILLITHDMGVIAEFADEVLVMYAGEVVERGSVQALFSKPAHPYTFGLLKSIPRLDTDSEKLFTIEGMVPELNNMPSGCRFSNRCSECRKRCTDEKPPMFNIFSQQVRCWKYEMEAKA